jgi:hypothetical protein
MNTKETVITMLDTLTLTEEQLEGLLMLIKGYNHDDTSVDSLQGALSKYANKDLIPLEEGAWERNVVKNH